MFTSTVHWHIVTYIAFYSCIFQWVEEHNTDQYLGEVIDGLRVVSNDTNNLLCDKLDHHLRKLLSDGLKIPLLLNDRHSLALRDAASLSTDARVQHSFDIDTIVLVADSLEFFGHLQFAPKMGSDWYVRPLNHLMCF